MTKFFLKRGKVVRRERSGHNPGRILVDKDRFQVCILLSEVPTASAFEMLKIFHDLTAKVSAAATRVNVDVSASCFGVVILT